MTHCNSCIADEYKRTEQDTHIHIHFFLIHIFVPRFFYSLQTHTHGINFPHHPFHSFRTAHIHIHTHTRLILSSHAHTHTFHQSNIMFNNSGLLVLLSQRFGHISSNRHSRQYHQLEDARQWFYCMQCDVGFGSRDRHEWHLQVCPATRRCRKQQLLSPSCCK